MARSLSGDADYFARRHGFSNPQTHMPQIVVFALLTAFCSATQDISLDAYRIESASADLQGALAATYQTGYRLAMIWAGAGAFALAAFFQSAPSGAYDQTGWTWAYLIMAASISVGLATTLLSPPPNASDEKSNCVTWRKCVTTFTPLSSATLHFLVLSLRLSAGSDLSAFGRCQTSSTGIAGTPLPSYS